MLRRHPPGHRCQDTLCLGPACTDDSECETNYKCDGTDLVCVPQPLIDYVGMCMIECVADRNCPAGWVCGPAVLIDQSRIQGYCRQPNSGQSTATGSGPCYSDGVFLCDHGICWTDTYCTQLCGDAGDCPVGMNCTSGTLYMGLLGDFPNTYTCTY